MSGPDKPPFWIGRIAVGLAALPYLALLTLFQAGAARTVDLWVVLVIALVCWSVFLAVARYFGVRPFSR